MALHFDFRDVANSPHVTTSPDTRGKDPEKWHPVADALVWLSLLCGFNHITEANYKKIAKRIAEYQQVSGAYLSHNLMTKIYITEADVKTYIGLKTNASPMSDAKWRAKVYEWIARDAQTVQSGERNQHNKPDWMSGDDAASAFAISEALHRERVDA